MTYATVMVNLTLGQSNDRALAAAVAVAEQCAAGIIGLAACRPIEIVCRDYVMPAAVFEEDRKQAAQQTKAAEVEFHDAVANVRGSTEWRARRTVIPLADHLALQARAADLIVVQAASTGRELDPTRQVDVHDLVMSAGRPVLLVPNGATPRRFERILVAWKDTREAQRAIADALPLLASCSHVSVVQVVPAEELAAAKTAVADILRWLDLHQVRAEAMFTPPTGANATQLRTIARDVAADLVVAGAYGYKRGQQWVLGGVTADLLTGDRCALIAH